MVKRIVGLISVALVLSTCTQKSAYEAAVEDMESVYCYKSLAGVQCYQKPSFRDERRMGTTSARPRDASVVRH